MKRSSLAFFRSFRSTLMLILLLASGLPTLLFSVPLIEKIYQITKEDALNELRLRAEQLAGSLAQQLELTASRFVMLGDTSDVILAAYSTLFRSLAAKHMLQFTADNPLVLSLYLVDPSELTIEAAPAAAEAVALPEAVKKAVAALFQQPAEAVQAKYLLAAFNDRDFLAKTFQVLAQEDKRPRSSSDHALALIVPLVEQIGEGSGRKEMQGALVAILPAEYLTGYLAAMVHPPALLACTEASGQPLHSTKAAPQGRAAQQISSKAQLRISGTLGAAPPVSYQIVVSEPAAVRFARANQMLGKVAALFCAALLLLLWFAYCLAKLLLSPVHTMKKIVKQYALGSYSCPEEEVYFAEFQSFLEVLRQMGGTILEQLNALQQINQAYARFVPNDLLNHLEKQSITEVQLGDHVRRQMTVMFSDIRKFTEIAEHMSPEESFRFVNSVLNRIGPVIREHKGFIDKYIGDSIMALFDQQPDDAIKAGIAMLQALAEHNKESKQHGFRPVRIGIGINTGELMLGIIGEHGRMEGTVISDAVNLASRLEGLTKLYGASLLISDQTFSKLAEPSQFQVRVVDLVTVKGKSHSVALFDVLDGEEATTRNKKLKTKAQFEQAVFLYQEQKVWQALNLMRQVLRQHPQDRAAALYVERCKHKISCGAGVD